MHHALFLVNCIPRSAAREPHSVIARVAAPRCGIGLTYIISITIEYCQTLCNYEKPQQEMEAAVDTYECIMKRRNRKWTSLCNYEKAQQEMEAKGRRSEEARRGGAAAFKMHSALGCSRAALRPCACGRPMLWRERTPHVHTPTFVGSLRAFYMRVH